MLDGLYMILMGDVVQSREFYSLKKLQWRLVLLKSGS